MLDYIVKDFEQARIAMNDNSIGGMVVKEYMNEFYGRTA